MQHNAWHVAIGASTISSETVASLVGRSCARMVVVVTKGIVVDCVRMPGSLGGKKHLNAYNHKDSRHSYKARHGRVAPIPEVWKTWIGERLEGGGEEVDEGSRYEHTGAEVSRKEKEA